MTRVTHRLAGDTALRNLQANLGRLHELNTRLTSGKAIGRPSDDPTGTGNALATRSDLRAQEQYRRNGEDATTWLTATEQAVSTGVRLVDKAKDLALQGMNGALSPAARSALALQVRAVREDLLGVANTTHLGRPVFGGTTGGEVAFDATGAYVGDGGRVERRIDAASTVRVDSGGVDVFGGTLGTPGTGGAAGDPSGSVFAVLERLAVHLEGDSTAVSADLADVEAAFTRMTSAVSDVGARSARTTRTLQSATDRALNLTAQLSQLEDVDLPRTILELKSQEVAYQASLGATAKVIQPTLMDFLR